jgi:hypothetical protein
MVLSVFDAKTSFFDLPIVRRTGYVFLGLSLVFTIIIIFNSDLVWDFSYNGFNNLVEVFRVPFGILAILIPIGAVYAANHRSEQTKEQIFLTQEQNRVTNYFKHFEEFINLLKGSIEDADCQRRLHKDLYGTLSTYTGEVFIDKLDDSVRNTREVLTKNYRKLIESESEQVRFESMGYIIEASKKFTSQWGDFSSRQIGGKKQVTSNGQEQAADFNLWSEVHSFYYHLLRVVHWINTFGDAELTENIKQIMSLKMSEIEDVRYHVEDDKLNIQRFSISNKIINHIEIWE